MAALFNPTRINIQKPAESPDCLLGVELYAADRQSVRRYYLCNRLMRIFILCHMQLYILFFTELFLIRNDFQNVQILNGYKHVDKRI